MQDVPPQLESFPATCRECHKGKRLIFNQNMYYILMVYVCMVCSCIICRIMSETLPTQTHFDRMCQQLCTYYVHIMCVCVCAWCARVSQCTVYKPKGWSSFERGWAPYMKSSGFDTGFGFVLVLGATCVFVFITTSAIYKK